MNRLKQLVVEAHRRSLWQVLSIYLVASWVGYQVISELTDRLGLPDWVPGFAIVLFLIGLPIVLATAFIQEGPPPLRPPAYAPADPTLLPDTFQSSEPSPTHHRFFTWKKAIAGGVLAFLLLAILAGGYMGLRNAGVGPFGSLLAKGTLDDRERVLIAEFNDLSGDTMLAQAVTQAFRVSFAQSNVITVVEPAHVRTVLERMRRPANLRVDAELAREVAIRDNIKALVSGEIARVGGRYSVIGKLISTADASLLATYQQEAADSTGLLPAIDKLSRKLREKIGESLRTIRNDRPLDAVTTPSLEALRKYSQAAAALDVDLDIDRGIALLKEAVVLDTAFAMAWRKLAVSYANSAAPFDQIKHAATKAYEHRDRLTEVERNLTAAYYHTQITEDFAQARQAYLNVLEIDPVNYIALNNIGIMYMRAREHQRARVGYEKIIAAQRGRTNAYFNLLEALVALQQIDSAAKVAESIGRVFGKTPGYYLAVSDIAGARHEYAKIEQYMTEGVKANDPLAFRRVGRFMTAAARGVHGRLADAERALADGAELHRQMGNTAAGLEAALANAEIDVRLRQDKERAARRIADALERVPLEQIPAENRPYPRLAAAYGMIDQPDRARSILAMQANLPPDIRGDDRERVSRAEGWIALAENRFTDAVAQFRFAASTGACLRCEHAELGLAFEGAQQPDSAIAHYEYWLNTRNVDQVFEDATHLGPVYERLADLYESKGNRERAADYAARFVELWKNADAELQPRVQAKRALLQRLGADRAR